MPRKPDQITIETERGTFDRFSSVQITNDIEGQTEAVLETGDDGSGSDLYDIVQPGQLFAVKLNGRPRMSGRAEINEIPGSPESGVKLRIVLRTKLADARYCSADPKIKLDKATIKSFVVAVYAKLGYTESDFVFLPDADRDLMTGQKAGYKVVPDIAPIKADQMKIQPNETIFACVERQLKRLHVQHWDTSDGRILVGAPDDTQTPRYRFQCQRGAGAAGNNVDDFQRGKDWSEVPSEMWIYGKVQTDDGAGNIGFKDVKGVSQDPDLVAVQRRNGHFYRPVVIVNEWAKNLDSVNAIAARERSLRSRAKDTWTIRTDAWTYWDGANQIPYVHNTTADIDILTGPQGRYLIHKVGLTFGVDQKVATMLGLVASGIWAI